MKKFLAIPFLMFAGASAAFALDAHSVLVYEDDAEQVWLTAASPTNVEYKTTPQGLNRTRKARSEIKAIYFYEPPLYKEAVQLFESRDYAGAKGKFTECKEAYKSIDDLPGNYSTLAGFYELECCRKLEDLEGLKQLIDLYQSGPLSREVQRQQLEVYQAWDAVRTKAWPRLDALSKELLAQKKWTASQIAQLKYCHGLALEGLGRTTDALNAFNGAFTADYTASEVLTKKAATNCLRILQNDEDVKLAMALWGTEDEDVNSTGYFMLQEAVALCDLWKKALGGGQALPSEYATAFLKFREAAKPKTPTKAKAKPKAEEDPKKGDKKPADKKGK